MARGKQAYLDHLRKVPLFSSCSTKDLQTIASAADEVTVPRRAKLADQGQKGREAYVIVDGTCTVSRNGKKVATPRARVTSSASCRCSTTALARPRSRPTPTMTVLVLDQRHFIAVLDDVPALVAQAAGQPGRPHPRVRSQELRLSRTGPATVRRPAGGQAGSRAADTLALGCPPPWPRHAPPAEDDRSPPRHARSSHHRRHRPRRGLRPLHRCSSGVVPLLTKWDDEDAVSREVFGGIPGPLKLAFYTLIPVLIVYGAFVFAQRVKNWERGGPDTRDPAAEERQAAPRTTSAPACQHEDAAARPGRRDHALDDLLRLPRAPRRHDGAGDRPPAPRSRRSSCSGQTYQAYSFVGDLAGLVFLGGIAWALFRRYVQRPYRIRIKTKPEHWLILGVFARDRRHRLHHRDRAASRRGRLTELREVELRRLPARHPRRRLVSRHARHAATRSSWIVHVVAFLAFLVILPITMLRHMFTSPLNMYLRDKNRPKGAMRPMPNLMETELETFGAVGGRGLHVEAAARHRLPARCAAGARRCARPTPPASRSTPARSC